MWSDSLSLLLTEFSFMTYIINSMKFAYSNCSSVCSVLDPVANIASENSWKKIPSSGEIKFATNNFYSLKCREIYVEKMSFSVYLWNMSIILCADARRMEGEEGGERWWNNNGNNATIKPTEKTIFLSHELNSLLGFFLQANSFRSIPWALERRAAMLMMIFSPTMRILLLFSYANCVLHESWWNIQIVEQQTLIIYLKMSWYYYYPKLFCVFFLFHLLLRSSKLWI